MTMDLNAELLELLAQVRELSKTIETNKQILTEANARLDKKIEILEKNVENFLKNS